MMWPDIGLYYAGTYDHRYDGPYKGHTVCLLRCYFDGIPGTVHIGLNRGIWRLLVAESNYKVSI